MSDRAARTALIVALLGHAALLLLLSLAWGPQAKRAWPKPEPMEVSLVPDVAPVATAPPSPEPPAASVAPEQGQPEQAPPAAPAPVAKSEPVKPAPAQPVAKAAAQPAARPAPPSKPALQPKPASSAPAKQQAAAPAAKPAPARTASRPSRLTGLRQELTAGAKVDAAPAKARGRRLGDSFLAGLAPDASTTRASAAAPGKPGPYPAASIAAAIARQIQPCADRQVNPGPGANGIVTMLNIRLNADGTLAATPRMVRQSGVTDENGRYAQRVVDLGVAAFKGCTPLKLPAEYYETGNGGWSNINYRWQLR